ncbi:MAG: chorismate mutase [bacterium]|nr:chorismate mutase [bacterium]MDD6225893.1 chorismate mutase [bacterium]MDY3861719.1 chorismate mutase [Ruminococcus sp.]
MKDLNQIRQEIDSIDKQLIELFKQRMDCAKAVGEYKKANSIPVLNQSRENQVLDKVENMGGEYGTFARLLYSNIMELSRALQHTIMGSGKALRENILNASPQMETENIKVAYQGIKGANGHEAVLRLFPKGIPTNYKTFGDVFDAVDKGEVSCGVLPVENSNAGSVATVYDLILKHRFYIVGALDLPIDYCLGGLKQSELSDIERVWSHPQSLSQCSNYIAKHNFDSTPCSNTAVAARDVAKEKRLNVAAICSYKAAEEYGLKVLDNHLQDSKGNTTRFIVISKKLYIPENADKISLCFGLPHVTGSLYSVLCRFNSLGLNLTKIESRPMLSDGFEYLFYLDFTGNVRSENVLNLLCALSEELPDFSFFGNYTEL